MIVAMGDNKSLLQALAVHTPQSPPVPEVTGLYNPRAGDFGLEGFNQQ